MNLLTPERRVAAAREVREGIAFPLSLPLDYPGEQLMMGRHPPQIQLSEGERYNRRMPDGFMHACDIVCDDAVLLSTQYSTQWDSLAHWGQRFDADDDGIDEIVYYNGYRGGQEIGVTVDGKPYADALGIQNLAEAAPQGRGVLVDLHTSCGMQPVRVGYDRLMRLMEEQRVEVKIGDFLLLHTGLDRVILGRNKAVTLHEITQCAGLDGSDDRLLRWIEESGVVALCSDNAAVEQTQGGFDPDAPGTALPLHRLCLFEQGIHLGELWYLAELAEWLRAAGRSAFQITAPPLRLPGAVGSPVTPIATV